MRLVTFHFRPCDKYILRVSEVTPLRDRSSTVRVPVSSHSLGIGLGIGAGAVAIAVVVVIRETINIKIKIEISTADCDKGWFGPNCRFKCRCTGQCDTTGECRNQRCEDDWFCYKCQYQDTVSEINFANSEPGMTTNQLMDRDHSTCIFNESIKQVVIALKNKTPLFFIRLAVGDTALVTKFTVPLQDSSDMLPRQFACHRQMSTFVNNRTVDIRCDNKEFINLVILEGAGVTSLCSVHVSRGRNVALRQRTDQTSTTGTHSSDKAVDGNTSARPPYGSCTLTNNVTDVSPTWTLTFDEPNTITKPWKKVQIASINSSFSTLILSLCEVEMYGACLPGKWGLDCKQQCDSKCPDFCSEWDGSCPTGCLGYYAPLCIAECPVHKWGVNCIEDCSDRCQYKYCNSVDGLCTVGCNGYSDPPYCTKVSKPGSYGINCANRSVSNCVNKDSINGNDSNQQDDLCNSLLNESSFGIGIGVGAGSFALIVFIMILIFIVRRKNNKVGSLNNSSKELSDNISREHNILSNSIKVSSGSTSVSIAQWLDLDDSTCVFDGSIKLIVILLPQKSIFFFIRLFVGDTGLAYKFTLTFETDTDTVARRFPCRRQMFSSVNNRTVDIRCENFEFVNKVILEGDGVTSVCSIYISSGRNVALRQPTEQTSTNGNSSAWTAVDGNPSTAAPYGSCTLTNTTDVSQAWTLTFNGPVIVNSFEIYIRVDSLINQYVNNLRLQTFDKNNVTMSYTTMLFSPNITTNINSIPIQKIKITATNYSSPTVTLSLCEFMAYGVCSPGRWDMDCKQQCDSRCPDFCNEWDGSCPTACLGYQAPSCTAECPLDKWGVNCIEHCSDKCQYKYCNSVDGLCTAGCNGYSDPPYCTKACVKGYYGTNCGLRCSAGCPNEECDKTNGTCLLSCSPNHKGSFCDEIKDTTESSQPIKEDSFSGTSFGIGFGVCAAAVVIAVGVIVVIVLVRRKRKENEQKQNVNTRNVTSTKNAGKTHARLEDPDRYTKQTAGKKSSSKNVAQTTNSEQLYQEDYETMDTNQTYELPAYENK
ncbi:hypothetical protein Btru_033515 [Bulinus truncatus]|nr:hypothetical protein Btru_033515 [Bulinus truncatus]